jgi:hypothetical protein
MRACVVPSANSPTERRIVALMQKAAARIPAEQL